MRILLTSTIKIPLSQSHKNLLEQKELTTMVEPDMITALSGIRSGGDAYTLYMDPMDLENLIELISSVASHEMKDSLLGKQFDQLSAYLDQILDEEWPMPAVWHSIRKWFHEDHAMSDKIQFEITETQRTLLIQYVSDTGISSWIEAGSKIDIDRYRISVNTHQLHELIDYVQFLVLQADQKKAKDQLRQLAAFLIEQQTE
jgi:hypothetical protein